MRDGRGSEFAGRACGRVCRVLVTRGGEGPRALPLRVCKSNSLNSPCASNLHMGSLGISFAAPLLPVQALRRAVGATVCCTEVLCARNVHMTVCGSGDAKSGQCQPLRRQRQCTHASARMAVNLRDDVKNCCAEAFVIRPLSQCGNDADTMMLTQRLHAAANGRSCAERQRSTAHPRVRDA